MARSVLERAAAAARTFWRGSTPPPLATTAPLRTADLIRGEAGRRTGAGPGTKWGSGDWADFSWTALTTVTAVSFAILFVQTSNALTDERKRCIVLNRKNRELREELRERYAAAKELKD